MATVLYELNLFILFRAKTDTSTAASKEASESTPTNTSSEPQSVQLAAESALMYVLVRAFNLKPHNNKYKMFNYILLDPVVMNII